MIHAFQHPRTWKFAELALAVLARSPRPVPSPLSGPLPKPPRQPPPSTDTVTRADGTPASGTVLISWPAFVTHAGSSIAPGSTSVALGTGGLLSVALVPNAVSNPIGHLLHRHLPSLRRLREPRVLGRPRQLHPRRAISPIRSSVLPTSVAMQTVSKSYVDTAIANALGGGSGRSMAPPTSSKRRHHVRPPHPSRRSRLRPPGRRQKRMSTPRPPLLPAAAVQAKVSLLPLAPLRPSPSPRHLARRQHP